MTHFPSALAAKLTGVTMGTLENWSNRGFVRASGGRVSRTPTSPRLYSFRDLIVIRVADALRQRGIDVRHLRTVVEYLRARHGLDVGRVDVDPDTVLMTDGTAIYEVEARRAASLLLADERALVAVPFGRIVNRLCEEARAAA